MKLAVAPLRRGLPINQPRQRPPSPREVARWITTSPALRTLDTAERLQRLLTHCPELDRAHNLVRAFAAMFDTGDPGGLPDWLNQLETSRLPGLPSLAKVIREDLPAVMQAITSPYSSGVNEGPHHRRRTPETAHGRPCESATPAPTSRADRPPTPTRQPSSADGFGYVKPR
ncbi:transposase [Actinoplanes sp. NPDC000266]